MELKSNAPKCSRLPAIRDTTRESRKASLETNNKLSESNIMFRH